MFIRVTQVLPEGTQIIEVDTDLVESVMPWSGHLMLLFESGHQVEIAEGMNGI